MRGIWRFIAGLVLVLAVAAGAAYLSRAPLASAALRWALASAGVENPGLSVSAITPSRIALRNVTAGADKRNPDITIETVDATFNWLTLLRARRLESVVIGKGAVTARIAEDGAVSFAGYAPKRSPDRTAPAGYPFESLTVADLALFVAAPEGSASGRVHGGFEPRSGGSFTLSAETAAIAAREFRAENARLDGGVDLKEDGAVAFAGAVSGDIELAGAASRGVALAFAGEGASWRDAIAGAAPISGRASLTLSSAAISLADSPALGWLATWRRPDQPAIATLSLSGGLELALADGGASVAAAADRPLQAISDRGDTFLLTALDNRPYYERSASAERLAASLDLAGAASPGRGTLAAERAPGGDWRFDASVAFGEQAFPALALGPTRISASGTFAAGVADADAVVATLVERAKIGRLNIADAAIGSTIRIRTDFAAKEMQASNYEAVCLDIKRTLVTIEGQDSEVRLADAEYCRQGGPLITARWGEEAGVDFAGTLTARDSSLRFVRTRFAGPPPVVDFEASYLAREQMTQIAGTFSGGRVILNDALVGSGIDGRFTFTLDGAEMSGEADLARVRIIQNRKLLFVAPLLAAGVARLADERIAFAYTATTERGVALGAGEGAHNIRTGRGETDFHTGDLVFEPDGLQPATLVLALIGIVSDAEGGAAGDVHAEWGGRPEDFKTSGRFVLNNISFIGPGRAISRTGGVSGELDLANLFPLKSEGPQSLEIKLLNLDSLIMENGQARFDLPGDDTVHIIAAEFPWYGGRIGAYDTVAAMTGERATTSLRAENVDLGALLGLANVDGLSGEGRLSGALPIVFEEGRARIVDGRLKSLGPGAIRYVGKAAESAASGGGGAQIAFSILRDLRFSELDITINGYLDGRINFVGRFVGTGEVVYNKAKGQLPVRYIITLDAALLELLKMAKTTQDIRLQIEEGRRPATENVSKTPPPPQ